MNVLILDKHPAEDGRLFRHMQFFLKENANVFRLHINRDDKSLPPGIFSKFGEHGYRINIPRTLGKFLDLLNFYSFCFNLKSQNTIESAMDSFNINPDQQTILHVHDPALLLLAFEIRRKYLKSSKIVYDRHEVYEIGTMKFGIRIPGVSRIFEVLSKNSINGIVSVSEAHNERIHVLFPDAIVVTVPNYSSITDYNQGNIQKKIQSITAGTPINLIYIGSLSNMHDRDIDLLIKIADAALKKFDHTVFRVGGKCNDSQLLSEFARLHTSYNGRFQYLGLVAREETVRLTEISHIGFFLIRPYTTYWVKCSPNKVFEYLSCGVVPVIRADIDEITDMNACGLTFGRNSPENAIIQEVIDLIGDPHSLADKIQRAKAVAEKFSFEQHCYNYMRLYLRLLSKNEVSEK